MLDEQILQDAARRDVRRYYLTTQQAADYCNVAAGTLEKLRVYGGGPVFSRLGQPGSRVIYSIQDLDAWVAAHRRRSTSDTDEAA